MATTFAKGYTTVYPPYGPQNRDRTPAYNNVLKKLSDSISVKINDENTKTKFVAEETKDDSFELSYIYQMFKNIEEFA